MATYAETIADVLSYTTYGDNADFVAQVPSFILASEERIFFFVQLPLFRKGATGTFTLGNQYLEFPADFLAAASLAIIVAGEHQILLNKDVSYIRAVYPAAATLGVPTCYALFDDSTIIVGPTPAAAYQTELDYFYKPASLTEGAAGGTTWLSTNAYNALLYGALAEAANWMKRTAGIDIMADKYDERFLIELQGLKNLGEARDRKDTYRSGEKRTAE